MKVISQANEAILSVLKRFLKTDFSGRMMKYCVETATEDGVLLFNLMTREMVLLTEEEYSRATELDYLRKRWFVVPEQLNEKECVEFVRLVLKAQTKNKGEITGYTIFTTTDCNARCFYCYEMGRSRIPMSEETARKVVDYIKNNCGGEKVRLTWYGGEPLMNQEVIDIICDGLREAGIEFRSTMITNAYLFDDATVEKAIKKWNIKRLQVTLDGTEEVYNRIKAFVGADGNPYEIVLSNIMRFAGQQVKVAIRMNMDIHNAENLLALVDEIALRFAEMKNLKMYAYHLFKNGTTNAEHHTDEEWRLRSELMDRLNDKLLSTGLLIEGIISQGVKLNRCMADSGRDITILPDGNIGLCDHCSETDFIGHIDREGFDSKIEESWRQRSEEIAECEECFYFPECFRLKRCMSEETCYSAYRHGKLQQAKRMMKNTYRKWLEEN